MHRQRFLKGAMANGLDEETALKIFSKINGHYMFPESHSHAFAITAYPGGVAQAPLSAGVLRRADEQPADGVLPAGDAQAGRTALRRAVPESVCEQESVVVRP